MCAATWRTCWTTERWRAIIAVMMLWPGPCNGAPAGTDIGGGCNGRRRPMDLLVQRQRPSRLKVQRPAGAPSQIAPSGGTPCRSTTSSARTDADPLIPDDVVAEVIKATTAESAALQLLRRVDMGTKLATLPVL